MATLRRVAWELCAGLLGIALFGCSQTQVRDGLYLRDPLPEGQARGYVEFRLDPDIRNAPAFKEGSSVWIYWEKEYAESTIKMRPFDLTRSQAVRFATPPGTQHFFIGSVGRGNRNVPIQVREGHVTPVMVRVVGQTARATTSASTYSGSSVSVTTTSSGVAYDWVLEWQASPPVR